MFNPQPLNLVEEKPTEYFHGFSPEEVEKIKNKRAILFKRDFLKEPVTLIEFKEIVYPFLLINRTEKFNIFSGKEKEVKPKRITKKDLLLKFKDIEIRKATGEELSEEDLLFYEENKKPTKVKKLTKKAIKEKLYEIVMKKATGEILTEEEISFHKEYTTPLP